MFILISGIVSTIMAVIGIVFYFLDNQTITIIAAVFSLIDSFVQVVYGDQKHWISETITIFIAIIISVIFELSLFGTLAIFICFENALLTILGYIFLPSIIKRFNKDNNTNTSPSISLDVSVLFNDFANHFGLVDFNALLINTVYPVDKARYNTILSMKNPDDQALSFANFFGFRTVSNMFAYFKQTGNYDINVFFERYNLLQQKRMSKSIESGQQPVPRNESKTDTPT